MHCVLLEVFNVNMQKCNLDVLATLQELRGGKVWPFRSETIVASNAAIALSCMAVICRKVYVNRRGAASPKF